MFFSAVAAGITRKKNQKEREAAAKQWHNSSKKSKQTKRTGEEWGGLRSTYRYIFLELRDGLRFCFEDFDASDGGARNEGRRAGTEAVPSAGEPLVVNDFDAT